jgi:dTDP-4-dehydrorhamnose reductase
VESDESRVGDYEGNEKMRNDKWKMENVFVLGHRGMLGHVVARYLAEQGHEVVTSDARYRGLPRDPLIEAVRNSECRWIVNALGLIKQKSDSPMDLLLLNGLLPLHLKTRMRNDQQLIHASTDCVFSGKRGRYCVDDECDAVDAYGLSKILGETTAGDPRCTVIRTSIIGPELNGGHGLMSWFLSQSDVVNGFVNHQWNGITTLQWAKLADEMISGKQVSRSSIIQPAVEPAVSKYELLKLIAGIWQKEIRIKPIEAPETIDRTLIPNLPCPALDKQLFVLKDWYCEP